MSNTIYYLSTCSTCSRIMNELNITSRNFKLIDIKQGVDTSDLEAMFKKTGSYEKLFSRVALKYRSLGLNTKSLTEKDYKKYILQEYTFLKRPVILIGNAIFIGNSKSEINQAAKTLKSKL